jgi:hypothetical protein
MARPNEMKTRTFTQEQFLHEVTTSGFLGAFKFWETVLEHYPDAGAMREHGDGLLEQLAHLCFSQRDRFGMSPQEQEAYRHFGLLP